MIVIIGLFTSLQVDTWWQEDGELSLPEPEPEGGVINLLGTREFRNIVT
ncbi:MAG: hypothetical protein MI746_03185 [Pseudomonadales bacterium]|nr:hypothetical protein [Pseudomonadales bacterium]